MRAAPGKRRQAESGSKLGAHPGQRPSTATAFARAVEALRSARRILVAGFGTSRAPASARPARRLGPDDVLVAVSYTGGTRETVVAVCGDTVNDLLAADRAGAGAVIGVLTGAHDRGRLASAPHTHLLDSVADLPDAPACVLVYSLSAS